ncbi:MAG TPA: 5-oxoprolinase subunit PxpA [Candidatus Limnocylindria bacterium]|nr:5-oxoprolinase subunit PxpA [Candidatus Limnocylindria bacterium]
MGSSIDFNSDLGEGAGTDMSIMPLITSANIACGGHAGNESTMRTTVELAMRNNVAIGAHPGYPDRERFGRVPMDITARELIDSIRRQVDSLIAIASRMGARVTHVKAHGALYNQGERDALTARNILFGVQAATGGHDLVIVAPPGSAMAKEASGMGMKVAREGFVDRAYEPDGTLQSRLVAGSLLTDPADAARQALSFVKEGGVTAVDGTFLKLAVDTLCLHGDTPGAPEIAQAVRDALGTAKVSVVPFRS